MIAIQRKNNCDVIHETRIYNETSIPVSSQEFSSNRLTSPQQSGRLWLWTTVKSSKLEVTNVTSHISLHSTQALIPVMAGSGRRFAALQEFLPELGSPLSHYPSIHLSQVSMSLPLLRLPSTRTHICRWGGWVLSPFICEQPWHPLASYHFRLYPNWHLTTLPN